MNAVINILGKKALGKYNKKESNPNSDNIRYEVVEVYNKHGKVTKHKERERPVPDELSQNDKQILRRVRRKAYRWDQGFRICCSRYRFGWSAIIGLIPFVGDAIEILISLSLVRAASAVDGGLPPLLRARMISNIIADFAIGFVPFVGDLFDMFYRANTRNAWLLDAFLTEKAKAIREGTVRDPDSGSPHRVAVGELNADASGYGGGRADPAQQPLPAKPAPARTGGFLLAGRSKQPDLETGLTAGATSGNAGGGGGGGGGGSQGKQKPSRK